jgi:hypothetical protein
MSAKAKRESASKMMERIVCEMHNTGVKGFAEALRALDKEDASALRNPTGTVTVTVPAPVALACLRACIRFEMHAMLMRPSEPGDTGIAADVALVQAYALRTRERSEGRK